MHLTRRRSGRIRPSRGRAVSLGFIGDSIWYLTNGTGSKSIPTLVGEKLLAMNGVYSVTITNRAVSGTGAPDWIPNKVGAPLYYQDAKTAFLSAGVTHVLYMLGANDVTGDTMDYTFWTNCFHPTMVELVADGFVAVPCYPIWRGDVAAAGGRLLNLQPIIDADVNGTTVQIGDVLGYDYFLNHQSEMDAQLIHLNATGSDTHSTFVANAIYGILF